MKYIKLFMLILAGGLFASCSDDETTNTNSGVTVEFESSTMSIRENAGYIDVPVKITGARNGNVHFTVTTAEVGSNPAKEDVHYLVTTKNYNLNVDTLKSNTVNVQVKIVNDSEENDARQFSLTIASAEGATLGTTTTETITIRDDDSSIYGKFSGTWVLSGKLQTDNTGAHPFESEVTISTATDDAEYEKYLYVSAPSLIDIGVALDVNFKVEYAFSEAANEGSFGIVCGTECASYSDTYSWMFKTASGQSLTNNSLVADWELEDGKVPSEITFDSSDLYFYGGSTTSYGTWAIFSELKLTKK